MRQPSWEQLHNLQKELCWAVNEELKISIYLYCCNVGKEVMFSTYHLVPRVKYHFSYGIPSSLYLSLSPVEGLFPLLISEVKNIVAKCKSKLTLVHLTVQ